MIAASQMCPLNGSLRSGQRRLLVLVIATLFALATTLLLAQTSLAAPNPLASGTTTIQLSTSFTKVLKRAGIKLTALAPLKVSGAKIILPVESGFLDSDSGRGEINDAGRLKLKGPKGAVIMRNFVVKTSSTPLYAFVKGAHIKLTSGSGLTLPHEGFGSGVTYKALKLTHNFAERLNSTLHLKGTFKQGLDFGTVKSMTQPASVAIAPTGKLSLRPDAATFAKLEARHVAINPVFPAELSSGLFNFPLIPAGSIAPNASSGTLRSGGSLELLRLYDEGKEGFGQVTVHEIWLNLTEHDATAELDVEPVPPFKGKQLMAAVLGLETGAASVSAEPTARKISVSGITATLDPLLATTLNEALARGEGEVFKPGEALGTLSFNASAE